MNFENSTVGGPIYHETLAVGVSRVKPGFGRQLARGVTIRADDANAGIVFVGGPSVTDASGGSPGFPLPAGESLFMAVNFPHDVHVVASVAAQKVALIGL